jgi:hypothetical protein
MSMWEFVALGITAVIALLGLGYLAGYLARGDDNERRRLNEMEARLTARHARPKRLAAVADTEEILAQLESVTSALPMVHPEFRLPDGKEAA